MTCLKRFFSRINRLSPIVEAQEELARLLGKAKRSAPEEEENASLVQKVTDLIGQRMDDVMAIAAKIERGAKRKELKKEILSNLGEEFEGLEKQAGAIFESLEKECIRRMVLDENRRIDGRDFTTVRPISCEVGVLPRTHGSALFTRGENTSSGNSNAWYYIGRATYRDICR